MKNGTLETTSLHCKKNSSRHHTTNTHTRATMDVEGEGAGANQELESINQPILGVEESVDDNLQQSYFNNNIGGVDSNSNNNNGGGSGNETAAHMPDHFDPYRPGQRFKCSEDTLKNNILAVLNPYGCRRLVLGQGSRANKDENTIN